MPPTPTAPPASHSSTSSASARRVDADAPARCYITDFEAAQFVEGSFAIRNCQLGQTRSGKPFIKCLLGDKTGQTPGRMWNASKELFSGLPTNGFVWVTGQTQPYQGEMQIIIREMRVHEPTARDLEELLPCTEFDIDAMFGEVVRYLETLEHPAIKSLAQRYLEDGELMERFCRAPAAMSLHHAWLGGLLEHTLNLLRLADKAADLYPQLNRDILLMGVFLHDLGKTVELTWERGFGYSDDGQLVGHIARGAIWLEEKARACEDPELGEAAIKVDAPILRVLQHIILSHHGVPEFGALKTPSTPEAIAISAMDNMDAKLNMALTAARGEQAEKAEELGGHFTEKLWALNTRLYRPDPTTLPSTANGESD